MLIPTRRPQEIVDLGRGPVVNAFVVLNYGKIYTTYIKAIFVECESTMRNTYMFFIFFLAQQPPVGQGFLIHEVSRSYTTTHHSR